jgi:hypothetical protein
MNKHRRRSTINTSRKDKHKHKAKFCNLYIRVKEERSQYIADFFTEDGMFVESWVAPKDCTTLEDFKKSCEVVASFIDTGWQSW